MKKRSVLFLFLLNIAAYSFEYSTTDSYVSSNYTVTVQNVSSIAVLAAANGTHRTATLDQSAMAFLNNQVAAIINVLDASNKLLASGYLFKGIGDNDPWNRLAVVADGYDPGNERHIDYVVSDVKSKLVFSTASADAKYSGIGSGYDLLFVDFADGAGDLRENSKVFLRILEESNSRSTGPAISAVGNSMGGVIVRLALLYAQKVGNGSKPTSVSKVKKFISVDAPHSGAAAVNIELQKFIKDEAKSVYDEMINTGAAKQLFYQHAEANGSSEFDKFQKFLKDLGNYPTGYRMYSLANGSWSVPYTYTSASYSINLNTHISFYLAGCPAICTDLCFLPPKTFTKTYKTIRFSANDFAPGSYRNIVDELDNEVLPKLNTKNIFLALEEGIFRLAGITSQSITGCMARVGTSWVSSSKSQPGFKPTFIPLSSVYDLNPATPAGLKNSASMEALCSQGWTPFNRIYVCSSRNEHIYFTQEYCTQILDALNEGYCPEIVPIISNLLR